MRRVKTRSSEVPLITKYSDIIATMKPADYLAGK